MLNVASWPLSLPSLTSAILQDERHFHLGFSTAKHAVRERLPEGIPAPLLLQSYVSLSPELGSVRGISV